MKYSGSEICALADQGGSLRTPTAYNGVVGLSLPSPGRACGGSEESTYNIEGVQGPMGRSVRDCALVSRGHSRGEAELLAAARAVELALGGPLGPIDPNVTHH